MSVLEHEREKLTIRRPTAKPRPQIGAPAFVLDRPLAGVKVGIRHEGSWRSWMLISAVWEKYLVRDGAEPVIVQTGERVGHEGEETRANVEQLGRRGGVRHLRARHLRFLHLVERA